MKRQATAYFSAPTHPFYQKSIIKPPSDEKLTPQRYFRYAIDSRDRNTDVYPTPSRYEVNLTEDVTNVMSARVLVADIPFSRYLIHAQNNKLHIYDGVPTVAVDGTDNLSATNVKIIELDVGEYTSTTLAAELQTKICKGFDNSTTVTYDTKKDNFIISARNKKVYQILCQGPRTPYGPQTFEKTPSRDQNGNIIRDAKGAIIYEEIAFGDKTTSYISDTCARVLGYGNQNYSATAKGTCTVTSGSNVLVGALTAFTKDLAIGDAIVLVYKAGDTYNTFYTTISTITNDTQLLLENTPSFTSSSVQVYHGKSQGPFKKNFTKDSYIIMRIDRVDVNDALTPIMDQSFMLVNSKEANVTNNIFYGIDFVKYFDPPLNSLKKLKLSFFDYNGNSYDFQNYEHRIEIEFVCQQISR